MSKASNSDRAEYCLARCSPQEQVIAITTRHFQPSDVSCYDGLGKQMEATTPDNE